MDATPISKKNETPPPHTHTHTHTHLEKIGQVSVEDRLLQGVAGFPGPLDFLLGGGPRCGPRIQYAPGHLLRTILSFPGRSEIIQFAHSNYQRTILCLSVSFLSILR